MFISFYKETTEKILHIRALPTVKVHLIRFTASRRLIFSVISLFRILEEEKKGWSLIGSIPFSESSASPALLIIWDLMALCDS